MWGSKTKEGGLNPAQKQFKSKLNRQLIIVSELAKEGEQGGPFRGGAITPDGLIDEDFEAELGTPQVVFFLFFLGTCI